MANVPKMTGCVNATRGLSGVWGVVLEYALIFWAGGIAIKIHEYQSKELLASCGVPVPRGRVAATPEEVVEICRELGGKAVVKAQVYAGGRGKAGGVKLVNSPEEGREFAQGLLGTRLVTAQTGPEGAPVRRVLVEEPAQVDRELYLALTVDRTVQGPVLIASAAGGMEIEEVAETQPDAITREGVDIAVGLQPFQARRIARGLGLDARQQRSATQIMTSIYRLFMERDLTLIEINPLVVVKDGSLVAVDAKISVEDDALFRQKDLASWGDPEQETPLEVEAAEYGISYVKLDGSVGCLVNGAGLAMATMDLVRGAGATPANFLDVGGGADEAKVAKAVNIMLSDPDVKSILVNIFGGILRSDVVARGVVQAYQETGSEIPLTIRLQGVQVEEARVVLEESGLKVSFAETLVDVEARLSEARS